MNISCSWVSNLDSQVIKPEVRSNIDLRLIQTFGLIQFIPGWSYLAGITVNEGS